MGALLRSRGMWSSIFAAIAVILCLSSLSPAFGQGGQSDGDIFVLARDANSSRQFGFIVADRQAVSQAELSRIEEIIAREGYRVPWSNVLQLPYYVGCPTGIGWTPCPPYNETIYLGCVVEAQNSNPTGRASFEAEELCLRRATNPSLADRLRYR